MSREKVCVRAVRGVSARQGDLGEYLDTSDRTPGHPGRRRLEDPAARRTSRSNQVNGPRPHVGAEELS